jgi:sarcosine oxidase subunit gamma
MADLTPLRHSPVELLAAQIRAGAITGERSVRLLEVPYLTMVSVRVDPASETAQRIESVLGTPLPRSCGEVTAHDQHSVLWLGPDEWLVISQADAEEVLDVLRAAVAGDHAAIVDVSANRTVLDLIGHSAREVLEKGCPVDLHPRAFADGTAVATTLARVPVVLWKVDATTFRLLPRSSFAQYVARWLLDAMQEFAPVGSAG